MDYFRNPKIIGAFVIGFAIVIGTYVISNFGEPRESVATVQYAQADVAPLRVFIPVDDQNTDGIEDWRDQFITAPAVILTEPTADDYIAPDTLTGQLGVELIEDLLSTKAAGPIAKTKDQLITAALEKIETVGTVDTIYDYTTITVINDESDSTIRTYGNAVSDVLLNESKPELKNEIVLLRDFIDPPEGQESDPTDLLRLAEVYKNYRDKTLEIPVPRRFAKEHLDLINVYHALHMDIEAMTKAWEDPMLPYVRLKRYEDDAQGLALALEYMYKAMLPYARVFGRDDSAMILTGFSGELQ